METLIATAFGRYVDLLRGEADQLTEAADKVFRSADEQSSLSPDALLVPLCEFFDHVISIQGCSQVGAWGPLNISASYNTYHMHQRMLPGVKPRHTCICVF